MKKSKKITIIIAICLIVGGLVLSVSAFAIMGGDISKLNSITFTEKSYTIDDSFHSIHIDGAECDVSFLLSKNDKCSVECIEGDKIYHNVTVDKGTLYIQREDSRKWYERLGLYWGEMKITVYLPETEYDNLYINTLSGDVEIADTFSFDNAEIYNLSGEISFSADAENELKIKSTSGNLAISNAKPNNFSAESVSGNINLSSIKVTTGLQAGTTSGNLNLTNVICDNLTAGSVSGDIELTACDGKTLKFGTTSGNVRGTLLSDKTFETNTTSGNVNVPNTTKGGTCEITTVSGDINIVIEN